jgi:hypothetical protein
MTPPSRLWTEQWPMYLLCYTLVTGSSLRRILAHKRRRNAFGWTYAFAIEFSATLSQRPVPDNSQHSQQTDIKATGIILFIALEI